MELNMYEEFLESVYDTPYWCTNRENFVKYSQHLKYRLFQAKQQIIASEKFVKENHPQSYDDYMDSSMELTIKIDKIYNDFIKE